MEKRSLINKIERQKIEDDLQAFRIVNGVIYNSIIHKMPVMSLMHLVELKETLKECLLDDGLPKQRLEEIEEELD